MREDDRHLLVSFAPHDIVEILNARLTEFSLTNLHLHLFDIAGALGGPGRPGNPPKKWGGFTPHLFGRLPGRLGPPRPPKSMLSELSKNHIL